MLETVLEKQPFSGFWIGWMNKHLTKSVSENLKKLYLFGIFVGLLLGYL
jgi:hypothetical protein